LSRSPGADIGLRHGLTGSALPTIPQSASRGCQISWLHWFAITLRPVRLLAPLYGSGRVSPTIEGFYVQAFNGSVALPVAGYDYNSNWTPLLAGLSPAGTTASFAAPDLLTYRSAKMSGFGAELERTGLGPHALPQNVRRFTAFALRSEKNRTGIGPHLRMQKRQ
jgi:hypothetical protein